MNDIAIARHPTHSWLWYRTLDGCNAVADLPWRIVGSSGALLRTLCASPLSPARGIVTYHRVAPRVAGAPFPQHNVTPSQFRKQISGLLSRGFQIVPLRDMLAARADPSSLPDRSAVITFDDGYESVHTNAWPVLRELEVPATVFVNTAFIDSQEPFPFDEWGTIFQAQAPPSAYRPLTTRQCQEMARDGLVELGAHTHTHQDFRNRPHDFITDLDLSVGILRERFGIDEALFAFPFGCPHEGFAGPDLVAAAKKTGVVCGLTAEATPLDLPGDPFQWGRFTAFPWDNGATLAAKIEGWYDWAPRLRRRLVAAFRPSAAS